MQKVNFGPHFTPKLYSILIRNINIKPKTITPLEKKPGEKSLWSWPIQIVLRYDSKTWLIKKLIRWTSQKLKTSFGNILSIELIVKYRLGKTFTKHVSDKGLEVYKEPSKLNNPKRNN